MSRFREGTDQIRRVAARLRREPASVAAEVIAAWLEAAALLTAMLIASSIVACCMLQVTGPADASTPPPPAKPSSPRPDGLFRSMPWGATPQTVIRRERRGDLQISPDGWVSRPFDCAPKIAGHHCEYLFYFSRPGGPTDALRLSAGSYQFTESFGVGYWRYVDRWRAVQALLVRRHGNPAVLEERWNDPRLKDDASAYALALAGGDVELRSVWYTPRSKIIHTVKGSRGFYPLHTIIYLPLEPDPDGSEQL